MSTHTLYEYDDDGDYRLAIQGCRQSEHDSAYAGNVEVSIDGRNCCLPPSERQEAAQALAGDEYRVVPAETTTLADDMARMHLEYVRAALGLSDGPAPPRDVRPQQMVEGEILPAIERLREQAAGEYGAADIARAKADALHAFADTMDRLPDDWILVRRDYGSEVTVEDLLRQTADRYVEHPYPILTQIRVDPKQPDRPAPVDPASVRVGDVVEIEDNDGSWMVRGKVNHTSGSDRDRPISIGVPFSFGALWPNVTDATVRVLQPAAPEPDEAAVEALRTTYFAAEYAVVEPDGDIDAHKLIRELAKRGVRVVSTDG